MSVLVVQLRPSRRSLVMQQAVIMSPLVGRTALWAANKQQKQKEKGLAGLVGSSDATSSRQGREKKGEPRGAGAASSASIEREKGSQRRARPSPCGGQSIEGRRRRSTKMHASVALLARGKGKTIPIKVSPSAVADVTESSTSDSFNTIVVAELCWNWLLLYDQEECGEES
ncbi:hypothetical protein THAOC_15325 [Thalassiosira oceanica]|uniref:Uncharacterized protein n=1 Tax=Thalassiosira oceanica TaxID=159749 RepID=K0SCY1_THAOC|nr:hypothetical protein THAOC_15325 [Thalassiosira oceanica]|eukprot:EJK63988.1 hypothetical protein THAOC_15325 [Thalassiosira oceanica]